MPGRQRPDADQLFVGPEVAGPTTVAGGQAGADQDRRFQFNPGGLLGALLGLFRKKDESNETAMLDAAEQEVQPAAAEAEEPGVDWNLATTRDGSEDARAELEVYDAILAADRAELADRAARQGERLADGTGSDTDALSAQSRMQDLESGHEAMSEIDLGNGVKVPATYMVNYDNNYWNARKQSAARRIARQDATASGVDPAAMQWAMVGKASGEQLQQIMRAILENRSWEKLPNQAGFQAALANTVPEGATDAEKAAASVLAYCKLAGLGTDCSGYVQHTLMEMGLMPEGLANGINMMTSASALTSTWLSDESSEDSTRTVVRPCDEAGGLLVQTGDTVRIDGDGHIGLVHQAVDTGEEIVIKFAHSTPAQMVYYGDTVVGQKAEGVREDVIAWNKAANRWKAISCAYGDAKLNSSFLGGFFRVNRDKITNAAAGWASTSKDAVWDIERDDELHSTEGQV